MSFGDLGETDLMEIGAGQHGEGGGVRVPMASSKDTVATVAGALCKALDLKAGDKTFVMINGCGATTMMEMLVLFKDTVEFLKEKGVEVVASMVGEILTVQEAGGFQMNHAALDCRRPSACGTPPATPPPTARSKPWQNNIGNKAAHDYHLDVPVAQEGFYVRGAAHCDYGVKSRLARMFHPKSGNAVMLAFDHGYIMGPTAGLERIDLVIPPLNPYVDVLMGTKGVLRRLHSPQRRVAKCVRATYDSTGALRRYV